MVKKKKLTVWTVLNNILIGIACVILVLLIIDKVLHFWFQHINKQ